jgi:hypothetical protein
MSKFLSTLQVLFAGMAIGGALARDAPPDLPEVSREAARIDAALAREAARPLSCPGGDEGEDSERHGAPSAAAGEPPPP